MLCPTKHDYMVLYNKFSILLVDILCNLWWVRKSWINIFQGNEHQNIEHKKLRFVQKAYSHILWYQINLPLCLTVLKSLSLISACWIMLFIVFKTHWSLGDLDVILKIQFSSLLYLYLSSDLFMIMPSDECHKTLVLISQSWPRSL